MSRPAIHCYFSLLALIISGTAWSGPSPDAAAMIEELGLVAEGKPLSENPSWQPRRVVVSLPGFFSAVLPQLQQQLEQVAGDVEVVVDTSGDFVPDAAVLEGADGLIGLCTPAAMANADDTLLWVHNLTAGMDHCTGLTEKQGQRLVFSNSKRLFGPTIAEHTISMMLSLARGLPVYQQAQSDQKWDRALAASASGFGEVRGKTMLVVGLGGIGTQVAWRAHGLGMRVIATRRSARSGPDYVDYVGLSDELHKLAGEAGVIVNALPLTSSTRGIFDKTFFASVKPGSMFLSIGRGKSTVTKDLVQALESGHLHSAGLDVTDPEPLPENSPLWGMNNVIITPHVSGASEASRRRQVLLTVENFRRYVKGEALLNMVDIRAGY